MTTSEQQPNLSDTCKTENQDKHLSSSEIKYDEPGNEKLRVYRKAVMYICADNERKIAAGATPNQIIAGVAVEGFLRDEIKKLSTDGN